MVGLNEKIPEKRKLDDIKKIIDNLKSINTDTPTKPVEEKSKDAKLEEFKKVLTGETPLPKPETTVDENKKVDELIQSIKSKSVPVQRDRYFEDLKKNTTNSASASVSKQKTSFKFPNILGSLEEKWYSVLDKIDEHIPIYNFIDKIDAVVPSFYLFCALIVLLLIGATIFVGLGPNIFGSKEYMFKIVDEQGNPLSGVDVTILSSSEEFTAITDDAGEFSIRLPSDSIELTATKNGFNVYSESFTLVFGQANEITMEKMPLMFVNKTIEVYYNGKLLDRTVSLSFSCSNPSAIPPGLRTTSNGIARDVPFPADCGTPSVTVTSTGFNPQQASLSGAQSVYYVDLTAQAPLTGEVKVLVTGPTGQLVEDATVTLYKESGSLSDTSYTSSGGIGLFNDVAVGLYYVTVSQANGFLDGESESFEVLEGEQTTVNVELEGTSEGSQKKLLLQFVDFQSGDELEGVMVNLVVNDFVQATSQSSDSEGLASYDNLNDQSNYAFIAFLEGYVIFVDEDPVLVSENSFEPTEVRLKQISSSNSSTVIVQVNGASGAINNSYVELHDTDYNFAMAFGNTGTDGSVRFDGVAPGSYFAFAETSQEEGESLTQSVAAGQTLNLAVNLSSQTGGLNVLVKDNSGNLISGAHVEFRTAVNDLLVDSADTNTNGYTATKLFSAGSNLYAKITAPNFVSQLTEPRQVMADINQTIFAVLESQSSVTGENPVIEFERIQTLSGYPVEGIINDETSYDLKFKFFVPQGTQSGKVVLGLDQFMQFSSTNIAGGNFNLAYYDCAVNESSAFVAPTCSGGNASASTRQLIISFANLPSMFYTFTLRVQVPFVDGQQASAAKFGVRILNAFNESSSDPAGGLKIQDFIINAPAPCEGDCRLFDFSLQVIDVQTSQPTQFANNVYYLNQNKNYILKTTVFKTQPQAFPSLTLRVKDSTAPSHLAFGNAPGTSFYSGAPFTLSASQNSINLPDIPLDPLSLTNGPIDVNFFLDGTTDPSRFKLFTFSVVPVSNLNAVSDIGFLEAGTLNNTLTITVRDSSTGLAVENAQVVKYEAGAGESEPTTFPECISTSNCISTNSNGQVVFSGLNAGAAGSRFYFKVSSPIYANPVVLEVPVQSFAFFAGPSGLDCVTINPRAVVFAPNEFNTVQSFTVSAGACEQDVEVKFRRLIDSSLSNGLIVKDNSNNVIEDDESVIINSGVTKTFKVDVSLGSCPEATIGSEEICPGEYRVVVVGGFDYQEEQNTKIGELKVIKLPKDIGAGNCFELCNEFDCLDLDDDSTSLPTQAASFDLSIFTGNGQADVTIKNKCVPQPPVNSLDNPKIELSTCTQSNPVACTTLEESELYGQIEFDYTMRVNLGSSTQIATGTIQHAQITLTQTNEPQQIGLVNEQGLTANGLTYFNENFNSESPASGFDYGFDVDNVMAIGSELSFTPMVDVFVGSDGQTVFAQLNSSQVGSPTTELIDFKINNYQVTTDTGAILSVTDNVNKEVTPDFLQLSFDVRFSAFREGDANSLADCTTEKNFTLLSDGNAHQVFGSAAVEFGAAGIDCDWTGNFDLFKAEIISPIVAPTGYTAPEVIISFEGQNPPSNETHSALEGVFAKTASSASGTGAYQNYQLILLLDPTATNTYVWDNVCDVKTQLNDHFTQSGRAATVKVFAMEDRRVGDQFNCIDGIMSWGHPTIGYEKIESNTFSQGDAEQPYFITCTNSSECVDVSHEAWAPNLQTLVKLYSEDAGLETLEFGDEETMKLMVVFGDSDPTGIVAQDSNALKFWRWNDQNPAIAGQENFTEVFAVESLINEINEAQEDYGQINVLFFSKQWESSINNYWPVDKGGLSGGSAESVAPCFGLDLCEAQKYVVDSIAPGTGQIIQPTTSYLSDFTSNFVNNIDEYIQQNETSYVATQKFHVILDVAEESVCYGRQGPNGVALEGYSGDAAVDSIRRSLDWTWNTSKNTCSPYAVNYSGEAQGQENENFVYCDSAQFMQQALNRILSITEINPSSQINTVHNSYSEWQAKESQFSAYLIKDGFGPDFLNDFKDWAKANKDVFGFGVPTALFGTQFDLEKYVAEGKLRFEIKCDPVSQVNCNTASEQLDQIILPQSGLYKVQIMPTFTSPGVTGYLMVNNVPTANILIRLTLLEGYTGNNIFYKIPFDGEIGKVAGQDMYHRDDYGVDYTGDVITVFEELSGVNRISEVKTFPAQNASDALITINVNKIDQQEAFDALNSFDSQSRGVALKIYNDPNNPSNYALDFTPSFAAPVFMKLTKPANQLVSEAFYTVSRSVSGQQNYTNTQANGGFWRGIASGLPGCSDFEGSLITRGTPANTTSAYGNVSCDVADGSATAYGFKLNSAPHLSQLSSSIVLGSVFYAPDEFYTLNKECSNTQECLDESCLISESQYYSFAQDSGANSITLNEIPETTISTVSQLLEGVKNSSISLGVDTQSYFEQGDFCIYNNSGSLEIWFNENYLLSQSAAKIQSSSGFLNGLNTCFA